MLTSWGMQFRSLYHNGWPAGFWYLGAHILGGLESHRYSQATYARQPQTQPLARLASRSVNIGFFPVPAAMLAGWMVENIRGAVSGKNDRPCRYPAAILPG